MSSLRSWPRCCCCCGSGGWGKPTTWWPSPETGKPWAAIPIGICIDRGSPMLIFIVVNPGGGWDRSTDGNGASSWLCSFPSMLWLLVCLWATIPTFITGATAMAGREICCCRLWSCRIMSGLFSMLNSNVTVCQIKWKLIMVNTIMHKTIEEGVQISRYWKMCYRKTNKITIRIPKMW